MRIEFENGSAIESVESNNRKVRGKGTGLWWLNDDKQLLEIAYSDGIKGVSEDVFKLFKKIVEGEVK